VATPTKQAIEAEQRRQQELAAGLVSERFAGVALIRFEVVFHDLEGRPVQRRVREYPGEAFAIFEIKCPFEGSLFDLLPIITKMISGKAKHREGELVCQGVEGGDHHRMTYKIDVQFRTAKKRT
jgi:hypothetical protein